jgi:cardiolipin synthase
MVDGRVRGWRWLLGLFMAIMLLAGCAASGDTATSSGTSGEVGGTATATATATPLCAGGKCGATHVQIFVEPNAGEAPVLRAIEGANTSLDIEIYLLTDRYVITALEDAAARGVNVRVLLEAHPYGGSATAAQKTIETLAAAGVHAQVADPAYYYTHAKFLIVDDATLYILTANLSLAGLGGNSYTANREYGVITTNAADVSEARAIFAADWTRAPTPTLTDPRLVVSPVNARSTLEALLAAAHTSLRVEDEEMYDVSSEDALIAAARRGVNVEVVLPPPSGGTSADPDIERLLSGGVHVRYLKAPYVHAKLVVVDDASAFTGSENFSATSLDKNRELGIIVSDPQALATFTATFAQDWSLASAA